MSKPKKVSFGLLVALLIVTGLELSLRLFHVAVPETSFVEERGPRGRVARFPGNNFNEQWLVEKPANVFRVLISGSSTSLGFPWHPRSTFGYRLRTMLQRSLPDRRVEVIHAGRMSAWSGEVREIVGNALKYRPDLVVVYCGQNEFLSLKRRPEGFVGVIARVLARFRLARVIGAAAGISSDQIGRGELGLVYPTPPRVSPASYRRVLVEYRAELERMADDCRRAGVPLVLSNMVYNLGAWSPDAAAVSAAVLERDPEPRRQIMTERLYHLGVALETGPAEAVAAELQNIRATSPGYAQATYLEALAGLGLLEPWQHFPGSGPDGQEVADRFSRAAAEEARTVVSHRACPDLNAVIDRVAADKGVMVLDAEREFRAESLAPDFDLFEDQCHPNLRGQEIIAESLYRLLVKNGLVGAAVGMPAWDERAFLAAQGMDEAFIDRTDVSMAIFLGLKKNLPFRSAEVRRRLRDALQSSPEDPFPALLEALVLAQYPGDQPAAALADHYRARPAAVERLVRERLTRYVDLRDGKLLIRTTPVSLPPLRGYLRRTYFTGEHHPRREPTGQFDVVFDLLSGGRRRSPPP